MRKLLKNSALCLTAVCLTTACHHNNTVYHSYQSLPYEGWKKSDTLSFSVPVTDSLPPVLKVFAEVRNRAKYPYHNLHLLIRHNLQDSTRWQTDTIAFQLADTAGKWTGNGWGSIYQSAMFVTSVRPPHPTRYTIQVVSGMKDKKLSGINDIGIRVEKQ